MPARADLTIAVDVATRTACAAVLRPVGTKAVDAALLLARMLVPEPMRPGWSQALQISASVLPHARLLEVDARMESAAHCCPRWLGRDAVEHVPERARALQVVVIQPGELEPGPGH
jgi:hypothetical protein